MRSVPSCPSVVASALVALLCACGGPPAHDTLPRRRAADAYVAMLEDPGRDRWQRPAELVAQLGLEPGDSVADVGTGSGYFLPHLLEAVGPTGRVVAQDVDRELLERVRRRARAEGWRRLRTRLGTPGDPGLEASAHDLILLVNVFHHVSHPAAFLRALSGSLAPGGRLVVVDYPPGDAVPEPVAGVEHRVAPEIVVAAAEEAGLLVVGALAELTYQYGIVLRRRR